MCIANEDKYVQLVFFESVGFGKEGGVGVLLLLCFALGDDMAWFVTEKVAFAPKWDTRGVRFRGNAPLATFALSSVSGWTMALSFGSIFAFPASALSQAFAFARFAFSSFGGFAFVFPALSFASLFAFSVAFSAFRVAVEFAAKCGAGLAEAYIVCVEEGGAVLEA